MDEEWFMGISVQPKKGTAPSGWPEDESFDEPDLWEKPGQITGGYHNPEDPHTTLVFEVHGWWWYAHDLEVPRGY